MDIYNSIDRNILLPLADLVMGTKLKNYYKFLMRSQWWTYEDLKKYQNKKLRLMIEHAYSNVPYYHKKWKKLNIHPSDIKKVEDLKKIPIIRKYDIRNNLEYFKSKDFQSRKPKLQSTGGSTGETLKYWIDWDTYSIFWGVTLRGWSWGGFKIGDRLIGIGGTSISPKDRFNIVFNIKNKLLFRKLGISAFDLNPHTAIKLLQEKPIQNFKYILGYPSSLVIFARYIPNNYSGFSNLKAIFTQAEVLYHRDRKIIEDAYGVKVFDGYGARDGAINAMECEKHKGLHLSMESSIGEFIKDNEEVSSGERGNVIVTSLTNYSFPFIRYEVGDFGIKSDEKCECGRNLPLLKKIQGRTTDIIRFTDGTEWAGPVLTLAFGRFDIIQYQVIQEKRNQIRIKIIKGEKFTKNDEKELMDIFKSHIGKDGIINLDYVKKYQSPDLENIDLLFLK